MWKLFDKIQEKLPGKFGYKSKEDGREEMFEMLTRAAITRDLLPFGKLMKEAFGPGAFRKYGHLQTVEEIDKFIDSL
jgi:hypothetical protein